MLQKQITKAAYIWKDFYLMSIRVKVLEVVRGTSAPTNGVQNLTDRGEAESASFS